MFVFFRQPRPDELEFAHGLRTAWPIPVVAKTESRVRMENWKSVIIANDSSAQFSPALNEAEIVDAEKALAVDFPSDLRGFFLQSDGVTADFGSGVVWRLSDVVSRNLEFRG